MILLLLLAWFLLYHGFVLWLALRFKNKPWRWYWFGAVLVIGLGAAWIDALYVRLVVINGYCAQQDKIGGFDYQPAIATRRDVTWLDTPEAKGAMSNSNVSSSLSFNPNILYCIDAKNRRNGSCLAKGYRFEDQTTRLLFGVWESRLQLWRNQTLIRERVQLGWDEQWFFRVIGLHSGGMALGMVYDGKFECMGPDRGIFLERKKYAADVIVRVEVQGE